MQSRVIRPLIVGALLLLAASSADSATTSRIEGTVVDDQGQPVPDVNITISSESLIGGLQSTTTNAEGIFAFSFLLVGQYTVEATRAGYTPANADVPVRLDRTASVELRMVPVSFSAEIEVGAEVPIVDVTRTTTGEVFGEQYLQQASVGSGNRFYTAILSQVAGVSPRSNPNVFGATGSENAYLIDGVNTTDPSTGFWGLRFPFDAIEEASALTGGFGAEFGSATGGVINLVTKSGGNRFSGSLDARYRDERFNESGEHYDPDRDVSSKGIVSATLGGPLLRDRLWFFAAAEVSTRENTPTGASVSSEERRVTPLLKTTWAINAKNRLTAKYSADVTSTDYAYVAWFTTAEATADLSWDTRIGQVELNSVLSDKLLLTAALGFNRADVDAGPMINDLDTPPEFDRDRFLLFSNPNLVEFGQRDRDDHRAMLTYFAGTSFGSHQLDLGLEYHRLWEDAAWFTPGGYLLSYFNNAYWGGALPDGDGDGLVDYILYRDAPPETARDPITGVGKGWSAFLQDEWRPASGLTLRLGLRYDTMAHTNTIGETVADFDMWLPRLGVAWDIGGRGRHALRVGWNRYMHPGVTNLPLSVPGISRGTSEYYGLDFLCGYSGICDRDLAAALVGEEFVHVDADGDEHPFYLGFTSEELPAETVDTLGVGRLRAPYRDELIIAYEARVAKETSVELSYVNKEFHDRIEDTCINHPWSWGDGAPPSLDDPATWTDESACTGSVRTNLEGLTRSYEAIIVRAASRARPWFHLVGSYTYSRTRGNSWGSQPYTGFGTAIFGFPGGDYDFFPTNFVNLDGNIDDDVRHFLKLNGYLLLPWDFSVGVDAYYSTAGALSVITDCSDMLNPSDSGLAELERLGIDYNEMVQYCQSLSSGALMLEPQGSRRSNDLWRLDLQLTKGFQIGAARLAGIVSVYNVFSNEEPTNRMEDPFNTLGWGTPTDWQRPRRWEIGLRLEF